VRSLLTTYVLVAGVGVVFQAQVYIRTDFFFVLMDVLRCGDLFHDGLRYCRYLWARLTARLIAGPTAGLTGPRILSDRPYRPGSATG